MPAPLPKTPRAPLKALLLCFALLNYVSASGIAVANTPPSNNQRQLQPQLQQSTLVIILDDMGNNLELGRRAIALPGAVNYAILPHRPFSATLATAAHQHHKEVLLHAPMTNLGSQATGRGTLTPKMNQTEFLQTLRSNLASVPYAQGVNNHTGSLLTQLHQPMTWLMQELKQRKLYFIDSRTSPRTVAESTGCTEQLPTLRRHIFLDNKRDVAAIEQQFEQLLQLAKQQGNAVAIGHPYPETLTFLEQTLPLLSARGFALIPASLAAATKDKTSTRHCLSQTTTHTKTYYKL